MPGRVRPLQHWSGASAELPIRASCGIGHRYLRALTEEET